MHMTEAFASAVTVSVPIFALAAGAEARGVRERLRRPDARWEQDFAAYRSEHDLDLDGKPAEVLGFLKGVPGLSKLYVAERIVALASAVAWLVVFVLLGITELRSLVWLSDGARPGDGGLATFALISIACAMVALIMAPTLYLLVPLAMPLDIIPQGLKKTVAPRLADKKGRQFFRLAFQELEGAVERAGDKFEQAEKKAMAEEHEIAGNLPHAEQAGRAAKAGPASKPETATENTGTAVENTGTADQ